MGKDRGRETPILLAPSRGLAATVVRMEAVFALCGGTGGNCIFDGVEATEVDPAILEPDPRFPFARHLVEVDANPTGGVILAEGGIALVLGGGNVPKVREAVVRPYAVDVIDLPGRPVAMNEDPSNPVGLKLPTLEADKQVAVTVVGSDRLPG